MLSRILGSLVVLLALSAPAPSVLAGCVPAPAFCTVEPVIVGNSGGVAIAGGFTVTVADGVGPCGGTPVTLVFAGTPINVQTVQEAGTIVDCAAGTVTRFTSAAGVAVFVLRLGDFENAPAVDVIAGGVPLAVVPARSTDLDGVGGTNLADLSLFRARFFSPAFEPESDLAGPGPGGAPDGTTNLIDLNWFAQSYYAPQTSVYCP